MGRKLAPLRKIFAKAAGQSAESTGSKRSGDVAEQKGGKKSKKVDNDDDDVDWEKLEKEQNDEASGNESGDDDEEESEDGDGIQLDGNLEHVVEDYTFEFNDMREEYSEGICTMLRKFMANPTEAYNLATTVTSQSKIVIEFVSFLFRTDPYQLYRYLAIVGTVVNCEGGQDSFAFATVLPLKKVEVKLRC